MTFETEFPEEILGCRIEGPGARALSLERYRALASPLVRPTEAQIEDFAAYVCGAKSWSKHLPLKAPGSRFFFYIDPHAGFDRLVAWTGKVRVRERTGGSEEFHYSWMTTADYRARFGYLAFSCEDASVHFTLEQGDDDIVAVEYSFRHPLILGDDGDEILPAAAVLAAGSCFLTALIHPRSTAARLRSRLPDLASERMLKQEKSRLRLAMRRAMRAMCDRVWAAGA